MGIGRMGRKLRAYNLVKTLFVLVALAVSACHREVAMPPLPLRNIALTDKFFDVWPTSPTRAFIVGDRGKVLLTEDGGRTFKRILVNLLGVFGIQMAYDQNGYLCGQDGSSAHARRRNIWKRLVSRTHLFNCGNVVPRANHGFFVGDRALAREHEAITAAKLRQCQLQSFSAETPTTRCRTNSRCFTHASSTTSITPGGCLTGRIWHRKLRKAGMSSNNRCCRNGNASRGSTTTSASWIFCCRRFSRFVPRPKSWRGIRNRGLGIQTDDGGKT